MRHVYVHVPFCARRCSYCDFSIAVRKTIPADVYVECIRRELARLNSNDGGEPIDDSPLETLYFGGGTPSLFPPEAIHELTQLVLHTCSSGWGDPGAVPRGQRETTGGRAHSRLAPLGQPQPEITLEANPDDVTPVAAAQWRRAGINRISLGGQSFQDRVLEWMHRTHDAAQIGRAVRTLRDAGFANISLDLIFALPGELERDWDRDLDGVLALAPQHISLYGLSVEPRTPLARWIDRGGSSLPEDDRYAAEYLRAHERLGAAGYQFYEVSNASRGPHTRSRHNSAYWFGHGYLGLGPAAHSYDQGRRSWNVPAWARYRALVMQGRSPVEHVEVLTEDERELERLYLALRTADGLSTAHARPLPPVTAQFEERGWLERSGDRLRCTPEGWLRLDALVAALTGVGAES